MKDGDVVGVEVIGDALGIRVGAEVTNTSQHKTIPNFSVNKDAREFIFFYYTKIDTFKCLHSNFHFTRKNRNSHHNYSEKGEIE